MGEPAKASVKLRVNRMTPGEGGVEIRPWGAQVYLVAERPKDRMAANGVPDLDMELDKALGGVVVRFKAEGEQRKVLVPMGHIRSLEFAE